MTRVLKQILLLAATTTVLVGCGAKSPTATYEKMRAAAMEENEDKVIACMDKATGEAMREMLKLTAEMDKDSGSPFAKMKGQTVSYGAETINGDKATLEVTMDGKTETFEFVKENGDWKITIPELPEAVKMLGAFKALGGSMKVGK
jgi:predicted small lipoprotein YifL